MLIKICGIKDPDTASFAAKNGAHFIGFIATAGFARSVTIDQAKMIVLATRLEGAQPVAVFVNASSQEIERICQQLGVDLVQAYHLTSSLSPKLKRFYINSPNTVLRTGQDFLLMESGKPGCGEKIDMDTFIPPIQRPWFIAGGLTPKNVKATIEKLRPDGVDVSSGVEESGHKSQALILTFIEQVKSCE